MGRKSNLRKLIEEQGNYQTKQEGDVIYIRKKPGVARGTVWGDIRFKNTRFNNIAFKECAECGKLLRDVLAPMLCEISDTSMANRLLQLLTQIKNTDTRPKEFKRLANALEHEEGKKLLQGFNFNQHATLQNILLKGLIVKDDAIYLNKFIPQQDLKVPEGFSHAVLKAARFCFDVKSKSASLYQSEAKRIAITAKEKDLLFEFEKTEVAKETRLYLFAISFYKKQFSIKSNNVLSVILVK